MPDLSLSLLREYRELLNQAGIPVKRRSHYIRWLKLYLRQCEKLSESPADSLQADAFLAKLSASYADWQTQQARHALSLAFRSQALAKQPVSEAEPVEPDRSQPDPDTRLAAIATRIKRYQQCSVEDLIAIGKDLIQAKALLPHGEFTPWIRAEFEMSYQSANRMMHVAQAFADKVLTVRILGKKALYELAAPDTPPALKEAVLKRLEAGEAISWQEIVALKHADAAAPGDSLAQLSRDFAHWRIRAQRWLARSDIAHSEAQTLEHLLVQLSGIEDQLTARLAAASGPDTLAA